DLFFPLISPPMSAIAMRMASPPALPSMSAYTPDMSAMKPMRITSSEIPAAWAVRPKPRPATASAADRVRSFMGSLLGVPVVPAIRGMAARRRSDAQQTVECGLFFLQLAGRELFDDLAVFHDVEVISQRCRKAEVLFDHDDRIALGFQGPDHAV